MSEAFSLLVLASTLLAAVARPRWAPEWLVAIAGAVSLLILGVLSFRSARSAVSSLGPTVAFLAALLVLADGCRRAGMFDAVGAVMARRAGQSARSLLAMVFLVAAATTAVLSLDATIVLLTPIVFATAARLLTSPRPHVYACSHLANTASLLLPVSNLTNLLAFHDSGLSFDRFAELMALPWLIALAIEWLILSRLFESELRASERAAKPVEPRPLPGFAIAVVTVALAGFALSSAIGVGPVWIAAAAATVLALRERPAPRELLEALQPTFLLFVLGLGIVVRATSQHGLARVADSLLPHGNAVPALLAVAAIGAILANLLNNLPATLIILPAASVRGPGAVLAMLLGVNIGPNLTYVGSLATLLWRRIVHAHDQESDIGEFTRLGALTVPSSLVAATIGLWLALHVLR